MHSGLEDLRKHKWIDFCLQRHTMHCDFVSIVFFVPFEFKSPLNLQHIMQKP